MHNISLELAVHWLSKDTVKFEIDGGFVRNIQKCKSHFRHRLLKAAMKQQDLTQDNVVANDERLLRLHACFAQFGLFWLVYGQM